MYVNKVIRKIVCGTKPVACASVSRRDRWRSATLCLLNAPIPKMPLCGIFMCLFVCKMKQTMGVFCDRFRLRLLDRISLFDYPVETACFLCELLFCFALFLSLCLSACLSVCLPVSLSLSISLSLSLSVCLCICLSLSLCTGLPHCLVNDFS